MTENIPANIRRLRTEKGLTQQALAGMLCVSGQSVSKWEMGQALPDIGFLPALARIFGVSIDALFGAEDTLDDGPGAGKGKTHAELAAQLSLGLPLPQSEVDRLWQGTAAKKAGGRRVLLVDDAAFMRQTQAQLLEGAGFAIVGEAADGYAAIETAEALAPDIILLDIVMPGMDGLDAAARILESRPDTVIVACSAMAYAPIVRQAREKGLNGFIAKPFMPDALVERVEAVV